MKTTNYNKTFRLLLLFLLPLWGLGGWSQDYQWQWAKHGGGSAKVTNEQEGILNNSFRAELIWDIATDEDNNYYFLGTIASGSTHVDGNPVPDYGIGSYGSNIIITSFTCGGVYRWSRVIGGGAKYSKSII